MSFASPLALGLLALAIPILVLHILRPQRVTQSVTSTFLWRALARPVSSARPWQKLRPSVLLLLQLLVVAGLALAAAWPVRVTEAPFAEHTVFIIDASGSMAATDGDPDRITDAKDLAKDLWDDLPAGGTASVVAADVRPRALLTASSDRSAFNGAIDSIETTSGPADFAAAFSLAAGLETVGTDIGFVLISDGGLTDAEQRLLPPGTTWRKVGDQATNRAITRLTVEPRGAGLHVIVGLANTGGSSATQNLRIDVDGETVDEQTVTLQAGEQIEVGADVRAGERVEAFLEGEDLLMADNHAYGVAPSQESIAVTVVGSSDEPDPVLEALFTAMGDRIVPTWVAEGNDADTGAEDPEAGPADAVIYNGVPVPEAPPAPFLAIAPPEGAPGLGVSGSVENPVPSLVLASDPLLEGLDLSEVVFTEAQQVEAVSAEALVASDTTTLLARGRAGDVPYLYTSFRLLDSTLVASDAFPILADRMLAELGGSALPPAALEVGDALPVTPTQTTKVESPRGHTQEVPPGTPAPHADRPGFWELEVDGQGQPDRTVAVNPAYRESDVEPASSVLAPERTRREGEQGPKAERSLLPWVIWPLLALVVAEWLLVRRRSGVSRRQFSLATAARLVVVLALLGALLGLTVTRSADDVATVFVVDASDSLGPDGKASALDWVRQSLRDMPDDAQAGVVLFGGDARLERTVQADPELAQATVQVDPSRTDLAQALRLGAAVLPSDARRRVVLVSDGRATQGDVVDEAEELEAEGIPVDVHLVSPERGVDTAIVDIDVPSRAQVGDSVPVTATVHSAEGGPARLELLADGEVLDERTEDLSPGDNEVSFTIPASTQGVERFQVRVTTATDAVADNDVGYGAVQVEGPGKVLVLEGSEGSGAAVAAALESSSIQVDVQDASSLPPLDALTGYQSIVLADVPADSFSADQVSTLQAAVRDAGTGMVTIGGTRSYGLGGYLGSELEALLPVVSDVLDPERRQTVAQVLAIDTSGSMGACHCADGDMGNQVEGGVVKTDIARAGAARAIDALQPVDEVGILAVDTEERWLVDLQQLPSDEVINSGLEQVQPRETDGTDLSRTLSEAASALRESRSSLKHIVLFTDGFVSGSGDVLDQMATDAQSLYEDEGISVSVIATGEMSDQEAGQLEQIAVNGGGRFYPGRDLHEIPQLMQEETTMASRSHVQEGEFLPTVTSGAAVVQDLQASPPLFGYLATTAKPDATTHLATGPESDPLLASWTVGLGAVTSWTSDAGDRWAQSWAGWEGYSDFWADVVRDTFPDRVEGVSARVDSGVMTVTVEGAESFPAGAEATARVVGPDLQPQEIRLERVSGNTFTGELPVTDSGSYSVGAAVHGGGGEMLAQGTALASLSYTPEYVPGDADLPLLRRVSDATGGRGEIAAAEAFDPDGLLSGRSQLELATFFLVAAAFLWPLAVALSRLALRGAVVRNVRYAGATAAWWVGKVVRRAPALPGRDRAAQAKPQRPVETVVAKEDRRARRQAQEAPPDALGSLLAAQRLRRSSPDADEEPAEADGESQPGS